MTYDLAAPVLAAPLTLPCGATLKNRLVKAAMTEGLADAANAATGRHVALYDCWARGGSGVLVTGNVQVDRRYLERPGNVAIDGPQSEDQLSALRAFATAATQDGTHCWVQLSHAGRQVSKDVNPEPVAPSAVPIELPGKQFGDPRALTAPEIHDVIARFAHAAAVCRQVGFTGVQLHAAHGYLLSEFLNPRVNRREDEWGGPLEHRARLLLACVAAVREAVGPGFPVAVKLNSADFQQGGFSHEDSAQVAAWLGEAGVDLLEISGGSYEQPRMAGVDGPGEDGTERMAESTRRREAYFLEYAEVIAANVTMPLMVTGGFRTTAGMRDALGTIDAVGLGRPLCTDADISARLLDGRAERAPDWERTLRLGPGPLAPTSSAKVVRMVNAVAVQAWFCEQIKRMGDGLEPDRGMGVATAMVRYLRDERAAAKALKRTW